MHSDHPTSHPRRSVGPALIAGFAAAALSIATLTPALAAQNAAPGAQAQAVGEVGGMIAPRELFSPAPMPGVLDDDPTIIRQRAVEVDTALIENLHPDGGDALVFNFFDDASFVGVFGWLHDRVPARERHGVTWSGTLADDENGWFVAVLEQGVLTANLWTGDGAAYQIRTGPHGGYMAHELDLDMFDPCAVTDEHHVHAEIPDGWGFERSGCTHEDDGSLIDVLVVYTPAARDAAGGTAQIIGLAEASIASTNVAYRNSDIETSVRLVYVNLVNYTEQGFSSDLQNLRAGTGPLVAAHSWREQYNADMVAMLNAGSSFCGIAYLMTNLSPGFQDRAFSVTRWSCAVGNLTFAHELGHNQGCAHDRDNAGNSLFPYSFGWRWTGNSGSVFRSVMAYSPGSRVPHLSNPDVLHDGVPTGVPIGQSGQAHNARTINQSAYVIANFRLSNDSAWFPVHNGADDTVRALEVFDGHLYAAGDFAQIGSAFANRIARWNGSVWSPIGTGANGVIYAMTVFDDGAGPALYIGGAFTEAGGVSAMQIARWDGNQWSPLGGGMNFPVFDLAVFDDGSGPALYAAGAFSMADGQPASGVARWDGQQWHAVGGGVGGLARALAVYDDGSGPALYAGGSFTGAGPDNARYIAKLDGAQWSRLNQSQQPNNAVHALETFDDGAGEKLYLGGVFTNIGTSRRDRVASWNGASYSPVDGGADGPIYSLVAADAGEGHVLYAGGQFNRIGGIHTRSVAALEDARWRPVGAGIDGAVRALAAFDHGQGTSLYTGGDFEIAGINEALNIARFGCEIEPPTCPPDWNGDGIVDSDDLLDFLSDWSAGNADYNGDGVTDSDDLLEFLSDWSTGC